MDGDQRRPGPLHELDMRDAMHVALGAGVAATTWAAAVARPFVAAVSGALHLGARVTAGRPHTGLAQRLADRGERFQEALERAAAEVVRWLLPLAAERALAAVDVTDLVRAHVDLDALAKILDVDAVVARVDLDAVISRVDLDGVASRLDLDSIIERADLDRAVSRVDLDAVISRVDLNGVASRLDLDSIIERADLDRAVSRVDLGAIIQRVDPDEIVARVDIEAALARLDLAGIARQVMEAIDLAEIIRESAGVVSSQAARAVRTEGMHADDTVSHFFDRILRRNQPGTAVTP